MTDPNDVYVHRRHKSGNAGSTLAGFLLGGLIGAGAMLLLAPQSGQKTREELQRGATAVRDRTMSRVNETVAEARTKAEELSTEARMKAEELKARGRQAAIEGLDKVSQAAETGKRNLKGTKE
jgi:gas vesicle protein